MQIPNENQTTQQQNVAASLLSLLNDARHSAWTETARFYSLVEDAEDPALALSAVVLDDPVTTLMSFFDRGFRPSPTIHGLGVIATGTRHLLYDEIVALKPDYEDSLREAMKRDDLADLSEEAMRLYYVQVVMQTLPPPTEMPEGMSKQGLVSTIVLSDGSTVFGEVTGDEPVVCVYDEEYFKISMLAKVLYLAKAGLRPDPSCEEPVQAVADHRILEALDF